MRKVYGIIVRGSESKRAIFCAFAAFALNFRVLRRIGARFAEETAGLEPFDFQGMGLTVESLRAQLPHYTDASRALYRRFFLADIPLPLAGAIGQALTLAALLRANPTPLAHAVLHLGLPLVPFAVAIFDWAENVCFLSVIERYPRRSVIVAQAAIQAHRLKLTTLFASTGLLNTLLLLHGITRLWRWWRR